MGACDKPTRIASVAGPWLSIKTVLTDGVPHDACPHCGKTTFQLPDSRVICLNCNQFIGAYGEHNS